MELLEPISRTNLFEILVKNYEEVDDEDNETLEGSFHILTNKPRASTSKQVEPIIVSSNESEQEIPTRTQPQTPIPSPERPETPTVDMSTLADVISKLNEMQGRMQVYETTNNGLTVEVENLQTVVEQQRGTIANQATQILNLMSQTGNRNNTPTFALSAAVRKAVKDLEKCTRYNVTSFVMGVKIIIEEFKHVQGSEALILNYVKLKIDDLNSYHNQDFTSVAHLEEVLTAQLTKVRSLESVEAEFRSTRMKGDSLDDYIKKVRSLAEQHYKSCTNDWKKSDIPATENLRTNEGKVVKFFIKGLPNYLQYRISNLHKTLDDAVREAISLYDDSDHRKESNDQASSSKQRSPRHNKGGNENKKSPSAGPSTSKPLTGSGEPICYNCGKKGHKSNVCHKPKSSTTPKNLN